MPIISALYTYPIKSCARLEHDQIALDACGLEYDRRWMIVYDPSGDEIEGSPYSSISQREEPRMAVIQPRLSGDTLTLTAPGLDALPLSIDAPSGERLPMLVLKRFPTFGLDMGEHAAAWLSRFLGYPARLMRMPDDEYRAVSMNYTDQPAQTAFTDGYPILIASQSSIPLLNDHLIGRGKEPVDMTRFRPNIVVMDCEPFAEDHWHRLRIDGIDFEVTNLCGRCAITTVDQATGIVPDAKEPLGALATFRRGESGKVFFGQNVIHRGVGTLRVGATVEIVAMGEPSDAILVR